MNRKSIEQATYREELLHKVNGEKMTLSGHTGFFEILTFILAETEQMIHATKSNFFYYNEKQELVSLHSELDTPEIRKICEYCIRNRSTINVGPDYAQSINPTHRNAIEELKTQEPTICVYLGLQDGDMGAIVFSAPRHYRKFYEADLNLIRSFSIAFLLLLNSAWHDTHVGDIALSFKSSLLLLLENASLSHKVREADYQLKAVLEVSNLINSSDELSALIRTVLVCAQKVLHAEHTSLFLLDELTGELYFEIVSNDEENALQGMRIPKGQGIVGLCLQEEKSIVVNDAPNDPRIFRKADEVSSVTTRNILASPLIVNGKAIGVIEVMNTIDRSSFNSHDIDIFESFSASVAIAIQRRRLYDDLEKTNVQLEKKLSETTSLHNVAASLVESKSMQDLLKRVTHIVRRDLDVHRVIIFIFSEDGQTPRYVVKEGEFTNAVAEENAFLLIAQTSVHLQAPLFKEDLKSDPNFHFLNDLSDTPVIGASVIIPLALAEDKKPFGVLLVSDPASGFFYEEDFRLLLTIASQVVKGYENFLMTEEVISKQAMEKEVEITSRIQQNILPSSVPSHMHMELSAKSIMAKTIGGDFYDYYVHSPNGDVTMLVADVSGKSLPAALFMAISSSILRTIIRAKGDPVQIINQANDFIYEESETGMFVTCFLLRYEPALNRIRYASAGHNEMLLIHMDGSYELLSCTGTPLGVIPSYLQKYTGGEAKAREGDLIVLYTDGVVEAVNQQNEEFGFDRLLKILLDKRHDKPEDIIETLDRSVVEFSADCPQFDDFTVLISRLHGTIRGKKEYHIALPARVASIPVLRDFISQVAKRHGLAGQELDDILLVCDEATTNIVLHAYDDLKEENPSFECDLQIEAGVSFFIELKDHGRPFHLKDIRSPDIKENMSGKRKGGFGVYLIRSLMDKVDFFRKDGVNYLRAEKKIKLSP